MRICQLVLICKRSEIISHNKMDGIQGIRDEVWNDRSGTLQRPLLINIVPWKCAKGYVFIVKILDLFYEMVRYGKSGQKWTLMKCILKSKLILLIDGLAAEKNTFHLFFCGKNTKLGINMNLWQKFDKNWTFCWGNCYIFSLFLAKMPIPKYLWQK